MMAMSADWLTGREYHREGGEVCMDTERDRGLKPTFRRPQPGASAADGEESRKEGAVLTGNEEKAEHGKETAQMPETRQEGEPETMEAEEKPTDKTPPKTVADQAEKNQKSQDAEEYEQYIANLGIYEDNLEKEAVDIGKLTKARDIRGRYIKQWDTAVKNAEDHWAKSLDDTVRRAQEERRRLRRQAEEEKRERQTAADRKEQNIDKQHQLALSQEQQLCDAEKQLNQQLEGAKSYVLQGYDCNKELKSFMKGARQKKYLSKRQEEMADGSIKRFCERWTGDADQLKSMESGLLGTGFVKKLTHFQIEDGFYKKLLMGGSLALFILFFLILVLGYMTEWGFFLTLGGLIISLAVAGILYLALSFAALFIRKSKDQKVRDSVLGIAACALALLLSVPFAGAFRKIVPNSLGADIIYGLIGAVSVGSFFNLRFLRNLLCKVPLVVTLAYKNLFQEADKNEGNFRAQKNLLPLKEGTVDAMICCYINHDRIMQHLSTSTRDKLMKELNERLEETKKGLTDCQNMKADLEEQKKKALGERKEMQAQNEETDARLKRQLEEVDRRYGREEAPDFTKRVNLLGKDTRGLVGLEQELGAIGFAGGDISDRVAAINSSDQFIATIERRLADVRKEIEKNSGEIRMWMDSAKCPPQTYRNGRYRYAIDDRICVCNSVDMDDRRPVVIDHSGKPVVLRWSGECDMNRMVDFVSQVWNGFARIAPRNLIDMFVVDSAGSIRFLLKKRNWTAGNDNVRNRFAQNYQEGYEVKRDAINNEQEQSAEEVRVRGIFDYREIDTLMDGLVRHQDDIETYGGKNPENMMKAREAVEGAESSIALVNYCRGEKGSGTDMQKYQVILFIVPEGKGINGYNDEAMSKIRSMIEANVARDYGILPVFLAPEHCEEEKWDSLLTLSEKQGITCALDINSLRLSVKRKV